jgi:succinyl-diaminopimelate desuccinylase
MVQKERLVRLLQRMIAINSENPPGREGEIAEFVADDMRSLGLDVKMYEYVPGRPNVVATLRGSWPRAKAAKEAILLTPHLDTVPAGGGWKKDPFGGEIVGGKLYGRGASDTKGNMASAMEAIRSLVEDDVRLKRDVVFAATADEEMGSYVGLIPLLKKSVLKPKLALVLDSLEFSGIIAQKGVLYLKFTIHGKKAHSAWNWRGVSAIEQAAQAIANIKKIRFLHKKHPLLQPPTINIGVIYGGDSFNVVADQCEFTVDHRFLPAMDHRTSLRLIRDAVEKVTRNYTYSIADFQKPYEIAANHPSVRLYMDLNRRMRTPGTLKGSEGATVMSYFGEKNIPAFAVGWGARGTLHVADEFIRVDTLYRGTKFLEAYLKEYDL